MAMNTAAFACILIFSMTSVLARSISEWISAATSSRSLRSRSWTRSAANMSPSVPRGRTVKPPDRRRPARVPTRGASRRAPPAPAGSACRARPGGRDRRRRRGRRASPRAPPARPRGFAMPDSRSRISRCVRCEGRRLRGLPGAESARARRFCLLGLRPWPAAAGAGARRALGDRLEVVVVVAVAQHDAPVLDARGVRRDGVDQRAVVRDEHDGALVGVERLLERLARLDVEVVRGLVEHEQVGAAGDERREREPPALAAREHATLRSTSSWLKRKLPRIVRDCVELRWPLVARVIASTTLRCSGISAMCWLK